jgi:hypothetical protein
MFAANSLFAPTRRTPDHFAEVIETSTTEFLAQCLAPEDLSFPVMPPFGSWVRTVDEHSGNLLYAVVYHATTSPIDSVHRARALGMSLDELRQQQPQIFAMLRTEFRAALVGFCEATGGSAGSQGSSAGSQYAQPDLLNPQQFYHHLPPRPPQIHQGVHRCNDAEIAAFTEQHDFLRTLLQVPGAPVESLVAATIRDIYRLRKLDREWLVQAGRSLSVLLKDDYDRLRMILGQIHP